MMQRTVSVVILACSLAACAAPSPAGTYSRRDVQRAWTIEQATIADVNEVTIEGTRTTGIGQVGGGAIGWSIGRNVGHGGGRVFGGVVGAVAGAVAGEQIERSARRQKGYEIVVDLDKGGSIAIVQPADQPFAEGERVRVYTRRDGSARVAKM
jgi:outer membrane lipoprotein SlyB